MTSHPESVGWATRFHQQLTLFGHRNWIGIVDAAYPLQTSPGIELIDTKSAAPAVVETVLQALAAAPHVQPIAYTDAELAYVTEQDAPGVGEYRQRLDSLLARFTRRSMEHELIIARLSEAGKHFNILLLKTSLTVPYTSVFLELECGYWTASSEERLRAAMAKRAPLGRS